MRPGKPTSSGQLKTIEHQDTRSTSVSCQVELHVELELHRVPADTNLWVEPAQHSCPKAPQNLDDAEIVRACLLLARQATTSA